MSGAGLYHHEITARVRRKGDARIISAAVGAEEIAAPAMSNGAEGFLYGVAADALTGFFTGYSARRVPCHGIAEFMIRMRFGVTLIKIASACLVPPIAL